MSNYDKIAYYYDKLFAWNFHDYWKFLLKVKKEFFWEKRIKILDLWCGTAWIFDFFYSNNIINWVDLSENMLNVAKKKYPESNFLHSSFVDIKYVNEYDFIFSIFDSINHLKNLKYWERLFEKSFLALKNDGCFFFDINTLNKFKSFNEKENFIMKDNNDYIILNRKYVKPNWSLWKIKVYEGNWNWGYNLSESDISEYSFDVDKILRLLRKYFSKVNLYDMNNLNNIKEFNINNQKDCNKRIWFLCFK